MYQNENTICVEARQMNKEPESVPAVVQQESMGRKTIGVILSRVATIAFRLTGEIQNGPSWPEPDCLINALQMDNEALYTIDERLQSIEKLLGG